jgi:uncharacterized membrane protein YhaH (DUF805 family)
MDWLRILFSKNGTLAPRDFSTAVLAVYVGFVLSHGLLSGPIVVKAFVLPFAAAQAAFVWSWYAVHAKRLSDAGQPRWPAMIAILIIACILLVCMLFIAIFVAIGWGKSADGSTQENAVAFYVLLVVAGALIGVIDPSGFAPIFVGILILLIGPALIAVPFSIWTGTRPRLALPPPATSTPLPAPS